MYPRIPKLLLLAPFFLLGGCLEASPSPHAKAPSGGALSFRGLPPPRTEPLSEDLLSGAFEGLPPPRTEPLTDAELRALKESEPTPKEPPKEPPQEAPKRYVLALHKAKILLSPDSKAELLGQTLKGARLPVYEERRVERSGCEGPWLRVQYGGWVCGDKLEPTTPAKEKELHPENRHPTQEALVTRETAVYPLPGEESDDTREPEARVRVSRVVEVGGEPYAQIGPEAYVRAEDLSFLGRGKYDTTLRGERWEEGAVSPVVFFVAPSTPLFADPGATDPEAEVARLARFDRRRVLERAEVEGRVFLRVEEGWLLWQEGVVQVAPEPRPEGVPAGSRWVLVDLSDQTISAYEGDRLLFASLVSSGRRIKTPTGTYGLERKYRYKTMAGNVGGEAYSVSNVAWAQFFRDSYALHGAHWHDKFGRPASHGCVNLAPSDALWLAGFLEPTLPPGWLSLFPPPEMKTSMVVVRE